MSHPETMLNVLRHCLKFLRQQSKEVPPEEVLWVRHQLHTPLPPAVKGNCHGCYHTHSNCKAASAGPCTPSSSAKYQAHHKKHPTKTSALSA